jgi:hypothetical protein
MRQHPNRCSTWYVLYQNRAFRSAYQTGYILIVELCRYLPQNEVLSARVPTMVRVLQLVSGNFSMCTNRVTDLLESSGDVLWGVCVAVHR